MRIIGSKESDPTKFKLENGPMIQLIHQSSLFLAIEYIKYVTKR